MGWLEQYEAKKCAPDEAIKVIESGNRVIVPIGIEPLGLLGALARRKDSLRDVEIIVCDPRTDFGWCQPGWDGSFRVNLETVFLLPARDWLDAKAADFSPFLFSLHSKLEERPGLRDADVMLVCVSPPDRHGYCSFGYAMWNKKSYAKRTRKVLAEVLPWLPRTYGDNFIHVSQIDRFIEGTTRQQFITFPESPPFAKPIAENVSTLVRDGDTVQIGFGNATLFLGLLGAFDDKHDLGVHSEVGFPGIARLVEQGIVTGRRKTLHPNRVVVTSLPQTAEDLPYASNNPMFELYDVEYVNNIRTIAVHDNMVAINNALAVDLTGQATAESMFGTRIWNGSGGQPEFVIGAALSRGGRSITVLPAAALNGGVSRIVPRHEEGTIITIPRTFTDYVVTEYGIAKLMGKSQRQRAEELIAIAHPDFRSELRREAQKTYYP